MFRSLRNWEARERRKAKEYEKERERERCREEEREREAKRLKEFLEDYDDERDDHKYYKVTKGAGAIFYTDVPVLEQSVFQRQEFKHVDKVSYTSVTIGNQFVYASCRSN